MRQMRLTSTIWIASHVVFALNTLSSGWTVDAFLASTQDIFRRPSTDLRRETGKRHMHSVRSIVGSSGYSSRAHGKPLRNRDDVAALAMFNNHAETRNEDVVREAHVQHNEHLQERLEVKSPERKKREWAVGVAEAVGMNSMGLLAAFRWICSRGTPAVTTLAVLFIASTTEDEILSAMGGLNWEENSQGRPAFIAPNYAERSGRNRDDRSTGRGDLSSTGGRTGVGGVGMGESKRGTPEKGRSRGDAGSTDLMQSLQEGGVREAGPLTHGF